MTNYCVYIPSSKELISYYCFSLILFFLLGFLFYRNLIFSLIFCLLTIPVKKFYVKYKIDKRSKNLLEGFRDVLYSFSSSIAAGRQMPQAISDSAKQLKASYGASSDIYIELSHIDAVYQETHADIGELLLDFALRSGLDEIKQFADSYKVCKKCGSDLEAVCLKSASLLLDKIDYQNEVKTLVSQKKLDIALLTAMPIVILLFLNLVSYSYIAVLYESLAGKIVMTLCLALISAALVWGLKIVDLKV